MTARGQIPADLLPAARDVSRNVWHHTYEPGQGPLHYATGPYWPTELQRRAIAARRLAEHCEQLVEWWLEQDEKGR